MKSTRLLSYLFFASLSYSCYAQEYSYTHYDISDGLAGSVVYCITQDKDGFIWTGTETGVSRFDGTHFRTYTAADGLPDIEVLEMFGDSKGRVWMAPFRKSVCYYYQGHIHNQDNDPALKSIHLRENVENFAEDAAGNILILESTALHLLNTDGSVHEVDSLGGRLIRNAGAVSRSATGHFLVQEGQQIFSFSDTGASPVYAVAIEDVTPSYISMNSAGVICRADSTHTAIVSFGSGKTLLFPFRLDHYKHLSFTNAGDSLFYVNEVSGATEYNANTGATKRYLPGKEVSRTFRDATGNTWFTTMGQGIFRLNSDEFMTIRMKGSGLEESSIHAIRRIGDRLFVGDNHNQFFIFSLPEKTMVQHFPLRTTGKNRILFIGQMPDGRLCIGSDQRLSTGELPGRVFKPSPRTGIYGYFDIRLGMKDVCQVNKDRLIMGTYRDVVGIDLRSFQVTDTLWRERSTAVYCKQDTLYIGTLNGLYRMDPDRSSTFLGKDIPFLTKRISSITESGDGTLWIASYDAGLIGYRNGRVVARIDKQTGLTSDICRKICVHDDVLWVGTDKGLNKIALNKTGYPVIRYTSNDGLGSDMINCIYVDGDVVYVGTPDGLSYFDQTKVDVSQGCRLHLLSVFNSGKDRIGDSAHLLIPYRDKHVRFEFVAISYRSVGDIVYRYRMLGLDTAWQETKESFLEYPILPSGKYVFQLQAINKFGIESDLLSMPVEVTTPFWQTVWFDVLVFAILLAPVWLFAALWSKRIRRRQEEKQRLSQRMAELENLALQSQMNPHFIFNCLNSIQQYVFDHEVLAANKYLTGFARLIRATLHNSSRTFISLADEIDYLSTYLSLEKLRFKDKMNYAIEVDSDVNKDLFILPPMLIQPFVENSMRHGLRHKTDGNGFISVRFEMSGNKLSVVVEDNGIGRKTAAGYRTREHIEYQSKGMSLTADRIRIMNTKYADRIQIAVIDLEDSDGKSTGTRVILQIPLFHMANQKITT